MEDLKTIIDRVINELKSIDKDNWYQNTIKALEKIKKKEIENARKPKPCDQVRNSFSVSRDEQGQQPKGGSVTIGDQALIIDPITNTIMSPDQFNYPIKWKIRNGQRQAWTEIPEDELPSTQDEAEEDKKILP